jgi:hypothetical protein
VRTPRGVITTFDAAGAGIANSEGTVPICINRSGAIAGWYRDASFLDHGFLRAPSGAITQVDVPGATRTYFVSMNEAGVAAGEY